MRYPHSFWLLFLSFPAFANWKIVQTETRTMEGKSGNSKSRVTLYLAPNHYRRDSEPEAGSQGLEMKMFYKGGNDLFFCRAGSCSKTNISELFSPGQSILSQMGGKITFTKFDVTPSGGPRQVGGKSCRPHRLTTQVDVKGPLVGLSKVNTSGTSCYGDFMTMKEIFPMLNQSMDKLMGKVATPAARKGFEKLKTLGVELEKENEMSFTTPVLKGPQKSRESVKVVSVTPWKFDPKAFEIPEGHKVSTGPAMPELQEMLKKLPKLEIPTEE